VVSRSFIGEFEVAETTSAIIVRTHLGSYDIPSINGSGSSGR
jgi:hypothetical protein